MRIDATIPLLQALEHGGVLVVGEWQSTGRWSTLPAVLDPERDDRPVWTGSRHLVNYAAKAGLIEMASHGRRLSTFRLSREGRALLRDIGSEVTRLRQRLARFEEREPDPARTSARKRGGAPSRFQWSRGG